MNANLPARLVTKSVRLSPDESTLLAEVSSREHLDESTLLRKWVLDALQHSRLELAIADYASGELNLGEAAARAGVSVGRMIADWTAEESTRLARATFGPVSQI